MNKILLDNLYELELSGQEQMSLNYMVSDYSDFTKRVGSFSKSFSVVGSKANNIVFQNCWEIGASSESTYNPNKKVKAQIESDGTVVFYGYIQLSEIVRNLQSEVITYKIIFFADLNRFMKDISGLYLDDLTTLSAFTHDYTWVNINSTWDAPKGHGYMYPMIDRSRNYTLNVINKPTTGTCVNMSEYYPAMYARTIWDAIHKEAGYSYSWDFANTDHFKSLIFTIDKLTHSDEFIKENEYKAVINSPITIDSAGIPEYFFGTLLFQDDYLYGYDNGNHYDPVTGIYTFTERVKAAFEVRLNFTSTMSGELELKLYKNGTLLWSSGQFRNLMLNGNPANVPNFDNFTISSPEFQFEDGDSIYMYMALMSFNPTAMQVGSYIKMSINTAISPGDKIEFNQIMPKMSQTEFIKSIVTIYHLYIQPSKDFENELEYYTKDDYYSGQGFVDWSGKIDISSPITIKPLSELNARTLKFHWQSDVSFFDKYYEDRFNEQYASYEVTIDNDFLPANNVQDISTVFAPCIMGNVIGSTTMQIPKLYTVDEQNNFKKGNLKPRILFFNEKLTCEKYYVRSDNTAMYATITYPHCSTLYGDIDSPTFDLNWGTPKQIYFSFSGQTQYPEANIYTTYYENTVDEILNSKLVEAYIYLTPADISQLNFRKQVFLDIDGGHYFKLMSVEDYDGSSNGLSKVTLLLSQNLTPRPQRKKTSYYINSEVLYTARLTNSLNVGKRNQILSNDNFAIGNDNTVNDGSTANVLAGQNNIVKANSSLVSGDFNNIQENLSSVIGGSGNTILALNSSILNSYNTQIQTGATSSLILGLSSFTATSANTVYLNKLVVRDLTGATTRLVTVGFDGLLSTTPMISSGGGSGEYWTGSTGYQSLKRNNSASNQLSGEYGIIAAGKSNYISADNSGILAGLNNSVYTAASSILGGRRNTIGGFTAYSSIVGGSGNTTMGFYSSILAGQNNYNGHTASSILAGRNMTSVSADTAHAQNLFVRNEVRISGLTGVGNRMVISSANGTLSTQSIPSYTGKWTVGSVYSSVILNNGYTSSNDAYTLVAGKNTSIGAGSPYSSILGGLSNTNVQNSKYSVIAGGFEHMIRDYSKYTFIGTGRGAYVYNSNHSLIGTGYGNRIYNGSYNNESKYNSILNGYNNKIQRGIHCLVFGYGNRVGNDSTTVKYSFVSGRNNVVYGNYSFILGNTGVALNDSYTTLVQRLQISEALQTDNSWLLNINPSNWKVGRTSLSGGTGIKITTSGGNLTLSYTGSTSSGGSYVLNGINTFTGGTSAAQSVNITGASLSNLTVSGLTSLSTVSATTIYSGSTDLSTIFEPKQTNYRQILSTNYVMTSSTATAQFSFPVNAGEVYKVEMYSLFEVNNTGGMKLTLSGNCLITGNIRGNTSSVLTFSYRPLYATGNTTNLGVAAGTVFPYMLEGIFSARTNTTIALGFSPQTNGQQVTVYSGTCMTLQKI